MFARILRFLAGNYNQKQIKLLMPLVYQANHWCEEYALFKDEDFPKKTQEFKDRISAGESLDAILPEAFGLVKAACKKLSGTTLELKGQTLTWEMVPYDVQLLGGVILHKGIIAEMKTGEGKTLVAVAPVYLNALSGKGVHVVTVNDYLASRDAQWMSHVYNFLGMTVGCVTKQVALNKRRDMYSCDIVYVENSELGFDYLRDNLVKSAEERNLLAKPLNFAIVDEIDSILIDEARTPLIISEASAEATEKYGYYAQIVRMLTPCSGKKKVSKGLLHELVNEGVKEQEEDGDYYVDEKTKTVALSGQGIAKLEKVLKVENLYRDFGYEEIHHIENALRAHAVYQKDREYIVVNGEVLIVDEHTGRTMPGRRFSEGLHQAIEAKETVAIQRESKTLATITYQNFFKQYAKLAGMTGTATTEGEEFEKIYHLTVLEIPTNKPTIRVDKRDKVYFNQSAKWKFVREYLGFAHEIGQPILIGTSSIDTSEFVSKMLEKQGIVHYVLNAKFHEQEAHIVGQSGKYKSVVVATNMAGRGTDIKLEKGLNEVLAKNYAQRIRKQVAAGKAVSAVVYSSLEYDLTVDALIADMGVTLEELKRAEQGQVAIGDVLVKIKFNKKKSSPEQAHAEILVSPAANRHTELLERDFHYGLFILGTEKHESRRIDNQLRGRAGRQGDPGVSVFFVALDDMLMKKMGGERIQSMASMLMPKDELETLELSQKQFTSSIIRSQKQMEGWHFGIRKHVFEYDSVIDKQRQAVYRKRDQILNSATDDEAKKIFVDQLILDVRSTLPQLVHKQLFAAQQLGQSPGESLDVLLKEFGIRRDDSTLSEYHGYDFARLQELLPERLLLSLDAILNMVTPDAVYRTLKDVYLWHLDKLWIAHLDDMDYLRDKVGLMGYAQQDPLVIYKKEAFDTFQSLLWRLKEQITVSLMSIQIQSPQVIEETSPEKEYMGRLAEASQSAKQFSVAAQKDVEVFEVKDTPAPVFDHKVGPNDPCPCGSGKKYKKCCGKM